MTKSIDEMDVLELRAHCRWLESENVRINDFLTNYRSRVTQSMDDVTAAINNLWRAS